MVVEPWAHVTVAGKRVGTTPITCVSLAAGAHELTLSNPPLGVSKKIKVTVRSSETTRVVESF